MSSTICGQCGHTYKPGEKFHQHTPEAETGGELRQELSAMTASDTHRAILLAYEDEIRGLIAAHTRRAVLLGKLDEAKRAITGTNNETMHRIIALEAELKEIAG